MTNPPPLTLVKLAEVLEVSPAWLSNGSLAINESLPQRVAQESLDIFVRGLDASEGELNELKAVARRSNAPVTVEGWQTRWNNR